MAIPADEAMKVAMKVVNEFSGRHPEDRVGAVIALKLIDALDQIAGWQCVPKEMTAEMRDLVGKIEGATRAIQDRRCWNTALAAAPKLGEVKP